MSCGSASCGNNGRVLSAERKQKCSRCHSSLYCSSDCQAAAWPAHKTYCGRLKAARAQLTDEARAAPIHAVRLSRAHGFEEVELPPDHAVLETNEGAEVSPVSALAGVPCMVWREDRRPAFTFPRSAANDNQLATWFMINPLTGFAPPHWQANVGNVLIARVDREPLTGDDVDALTAFCSDRLDQFGDGEGVPLSDFGERAYAQHRRRYLREQRRYKKQCAKHDRLHEAGVPDDDEAWEDEDD